MKDTNSDANWNKMYAIMLSAADDAISMLEQGDVSAAEELLKKAMLECEDEYIDSCG